MTGATTHRCEVCRQVVPVRRDGTFRSHLTEGTATLCPGSRKAAPRDLGDAREWTPSTFRRMMLDG